MSLLLLFGILFLVALGIVAALLKGRNPAKYYLAAEAIVCVTGCLAAGLAAGVSVFLDTWPDGPDIRYSLLIAKAVAWALGAMSPFAGALYFLDQHRREAGFKSQGEHQTRV